MFPGAAGTRRSTCQAKTTRTEFLAPKRSRALVMTETALLKAYNVAASGVIGALRGKKIAGFYVCSTDSGTIQFFDGEDDTGRELSGVITPAVGYHPFPTGVIVGVYVDIGGAALNVTVFVEE